MTEQAIPWRAIPPDANLYMKIDVISVVERCNGDPNSLTLVVATERSLLGTSRAWRITFHGIAAYRMGPIADMSEGARSPARPMPHRKSTSTLDVALWEVVHSRWLAELQSFHLVERPLHHYVIADFDELYEIAASGWLTEEAPETWEAEQ